MSVIWASAIIRTWISGVDFLIAKGMVDKDRVGAMGWSQGGYISAFITTYSDRFKAVSVGAGISDWMTYYVNTDIHPFTRPVSEGHALGRSNHLSEDFADLLREQCQDPTLIQHGDQDKRVPPPNAFELYQALKDRGVPTKLILYKGFGHPINKPKQQRRRDGAQLRMVREVHLGRGAADARRDQVNSRAYMTTRCFGEQSSHPRGCWPPLLLRPEQGHRAQGRTHVRRTPHAVSGNCGGKRLHILGVGAEAAVPSGSR